MNKATHVRLMQTACVLTTTAAASLLLLSYTNAALST
jgi:hypothetical protein